MAGRFSDLAVASTNHRKTQASSTAAGGAYVLRRLTPPQTAKVQLKGLYFSEPASRSRLCQPEALPVAVVRGQSPSRPCCRAWPVPRSPQRRPSGRRGAAVLCRILLDGRRMGRPWTGTIIYINSKTRLFILDFLSGKAIL